MEILKFFKKITKKPFFDDFRLIHSLKTAFGCLIGLGLVYYYQWPSGQWVPITIMVVMSAQAHFGGALQKAYMRFLGTFAGVGITLLVLTYFGNSEIATFIAVFFACAFFTYIASGGGNISYAGTLGGVTVLLTLTGIGTNVYFAIQRGLYIAVGIIIALLVSRLVFPIHARDRLRMSVAKALRDLRKLYISALALDKAGNFFSSGDKLDSLILSNFEDQPILIEEAAAGSRRFRSYNKAKYVEIVKIERKIYRLIYFIRMVLQQDESVGKIVPKISAICRLSVVIDKWLEELAKYIEAPHSIEINNVDVNADIKKISNIIKKMPDEHNIQKLLDEHSVLFFLEQIVREIDNLRKLVLQISF